MLSDRAKSLNQLQVARSGINELITSNRSYEENDSSKLAEVRIQLKMVETNQRELNIEMEKYRGKLEDLKLELARHEIKERELNDNLNLRCKREEFDVKKKAYDNKKQEMDVIDVNFNMKTFQAEKEAAEERERQLKKEYQDMQTKMSLMEGK